MIKKICLFVLFCVICSGLPYATEETLDFGKFGPITLYYKQPRPAHVVLFVSGDGGWNLGVVDMARTLAGLDSLVVGIDIVKYLRGLERGEEKCLYPASDFEELSKFVQKRLKFTDYVTPVLVGYSSGATLVYATLVQAPATTFRGAISLGFCPDLLLTKPMCKGSGLEWTDGPKGKGYLFRPAPGLEVPWAVLQGQVDQVCNSAGTAEFVHQTRNGELISLPRVGHGFAVPKNWLPQFTEAFARMVERRETWELPPRTDELKDLPLIEVNAAGSSDKMAVFITGDGGWGVTDRGVSNGLAAAGIPVAGLNSLKYFWNRKTPETAATDLARILRHYLAAWKKTQVLLIGYSMGADVATFMASRLPGDLLDKVSLIVLLGPSRTVDFEFHLSNWMGNFTHSTDRPVLPELEKLRGKRIVCFYGAEETDSLCPGLDAALAKVVMLRGGHRIGGNFSLVLAEILEETRPAAGGVEH